MGFRLLGLVAPEPPTWLASLQDARALSNNGNGRRPIRRYVTYAIAAVAFVAIMVGFSSQAKWPETAAMTLLAVALVAGLLAPPVRRAALQRKRAFVWAGIAIMALSVGALAMTLAYPSAVSVDLGAGASVAFLLVGSMVAWLPQMSTTMERAVQVQKSLGSGRPVPQAPFSPAAEAGEALRAPVAQWGPFLRVVGPWLLAFCVLPLVLVVLGETANPKAIDPSQAVTVLLVFLGVILSEFLILIVAAIQWTRFVATGQEPPLARLPGRALWGWAWRLFIFGSIFRFSDKIEPWLGQRLPSAEPWLLHAASSAALLCLVVLATPFAINLTSVALGDPSRAIEARAKIFRATGRRIYAGAALVLLPYFLFAWASDTFGDQVKGTTAQSTFGYVYLIVLFLTVIAFFGYLAHLYTRAAEPIAAFPG